MALRKSLNLIKATEGPLPRPDGLEMPSEVLHISHFCGSHDPLRSSLRYSKSGTHTCSDAMMNGRACQ